MKKITSLFSIVVACLLFSACSKNENNENNEKELINTEVSNEIVKVDINEDQGELAKLMSKGAKIKCEYVLNNEEGEMKTIFYLEGENFRTESNFGEMNSVAIFDGNVYHNWTEVNGVIQGSKMTKECLDEMDNEDSENGEIVEEMQFQSTQEIVDREVELQMNCVEIDKIDFSIPSDINFVDVCSMMKGVDNIQTDEMDMSEIQKQMEQMQIEMP